MSIKINPVIQTPGAIPHSGNMIAYVTCWKEYVQTEPAYIALILLSRWYVNNIHGDVLHLTDRKGGIQNSYAREYAVDNGADRKLLTLCGRGVG
ncbi:hypothetical protein [Paenibacillus kribbensis]|uniref:hypothetical protein n=1 Tax=Paenibacillus kribbensis TaxID=172713 RepID=UPI001FCA0D21|nr:hypothetical protein [Paenibacillus kribbensis]